MTKPKGFEGADCLEGAKRVPDYSPKKLVRSKHTKKPRGCYMDLEDKGRMNSHAAHS